MAKFPDLGKLTEKIDLEGLMANVKSLVNPNSKIPPGKEGDEIGQKLAEMSEITHRLAETYAHQQRDLAKLASLMKGVYDILHAEHPKIESVAQPQKPKEADKPGTPQSKEEKPEDKKDDPKE